MSSRIPSMHAVKRDLADGRGVSRAAALAELTRIRPADGERLLRRFERVFAHLHWDTAACFVRSLPAKCTDEDVVLLSDIIDVAYSGGIKGRKEAIFKWLRACYLIAASV